MTLRITICENCGQQTGMYESGRIESIAANKCRCVPASPPATGKCAGCGEVGCPGYTIEYDAEGIAMGQTLCPVPASPRETDDRSLLSLIAPIELTGLEGAAPVASGTPKCAWCLDDDLPCKHCGGSPAPAEPLTNPSTLAGNVNNPAAPGVDWDDAFFTKPDRHRYRESVWMARVEAQVRALIDAAVKRCEENFGKATSPHLDGETLTRVWNAYHDLNRSPR